jgi:hypothetical protein
MMVTRTIAVINMDVGDMEMMRRTITVMGNMEVSMVMRIMMMESMDLRALGRRAKGPTMTTARTATRQRDRGGVVVEPARMGMSMTSIHPVQDQVQDTTIQSLDIHLPSRILIPNSTMDSIVHHHISRMRMTVRSYLLSTLR